MAREIIPAERPATSMIVDYKTEMLFQAESGRGETETVDKRDKDIKREDSAET